MPEQDVPEGRKPWLSLRARIALWFLLVFLLIQGGLGAVVYVYQRASIDRFFSLQLTARATAIADELEDLPGSIADETLTEMSFRRMNLAMFELLRLAVYDSNGGVLASSSRPAPNVATDVIRAAAQGAGPVEVKSPPPLLQMTRRTEEQARVILIPWTGGDRQTRVLLVGTSDLFAREMLAVMERVFLVTIPMGLIAAGVAAWIIAGLGIAPVRQMHELLQGFRPESISKAIELDADEPDVARLRQDLEQARQRIEAGFRAQARFMTNVSHELKTPVSVVLTEAETLSLGDASEDVKAFVQSARSEMRRLGRMIESFLQLTRVREGRGATVNRRTLVNEIVADSVAICSPMARSYNVRLEPRLLDEEGQLDVAVLGDPELLRTMLDNLLRNAIRFSPAEETVIVSVTTHGEQVDISVEDRGPGISPELAEKVFDRFAQAESEERRGRGHGLGLEIAQGTAELHGGNISVRNCEGPGCIFTVSLPIAPESSFQPPAQGGDE